MSTTHSIWRCLVCEGYPEFEHQEMMKHFREAHGIDPKTTKAERSMVMHLDGQGFHSSTYEYDVYGMKFAQYIHTEKGKS